MIFLGKTKSEQYFGFLPFFLNIELVLDFTWIQVKDLWSYGIITYFTLLSIINSALAYLFTKYKFKLIENFTLNTPKGDHINSKKSTYTKSLINNENSTLNTKLYPKLAYSLSLFQYTLNRLNIDLPVIHHAPITTTTLKTGCSLFFTSKVDLISLKNLIKSNPLFRDTNELVLDSEFRYIRNISYSKYMVKNLKNANLSQISYFSNLRKNMLKFDFNLLNSLNNSKEQR